MSANLITRVPEYTASDALNDALVNAGVSHIFLNSGTDYPPFIESWAKYEAQGRLKPEIIISPHEYVAISAAQGYAQVSGRPQAVFVHVDVGTQNLGGALHNAFRCRTPVFILAGLSPYTIGRELRGGRDSPIQYLQNVQDQAGIARGYTKLCGELRSGRNVQQLVYRALQIANSEPKGPVYMTATREVLEEEGLDTNADLKLWSPALLAGMDDGTVERLSVALKKAEKPLIVTSYLGRNKESVGELVRLCERLAIPVIEAGQSYMNFPADHPMHLGFMTQPLLGEADLVLVIDSDIPWTPGMAEMREDCRIFYLDIDPLKEDIPIWYIPSEMFIKADSCIALKQLNGRLDMDGRGLDPALLAARREKLEKMHTDMLDRIKRSEKKQPGMTAEYLSSCIREIIDDDTIVLNEAITNGGAAMNHIPRVKPGTSFSSGGSSLGWSGGAAIGMKLACPENDVITLTGDGAYMLSVPTAVYWMARRYKTPFITVIYNNQGWNAPKEITKVQHPDGYAVRENKFWNSFEPASRLDLVAEAAGGAFARMVTKPDEVMPALLEGRDAVRNGTSAVINVLLPPV